MANDICFLHDTGADIPREGGPYGPLSVTSHIKWSVARCLINVYLKHVSLLSHDDDALFE